MDGYIGISVITLVIVIVFIVLLLILPVLVLSMYDKGKKMNEESIESKQVMMSQGSRPEWISKKIDSDECFAFIIFTVITVMILIPVLYILFFYE
ncbi:hypothetical protein EX227_22145 [Providencia rettgeri]|uniref:Uncharacterized protein n=1 Tax=Providencia rettgeri TaxID=587 RepID=A0AAP2NX86_PRORE|nr:MULTISPECIES: hypothetical protein [Providencia]ELR5132268.1 hypothetical protein [Providencia rettgeri]ELR5198308.1 hypothetical protein [Providencia rettgeri]ELR5227999.1 hypothetical protein [Providencia rettgeri]ELR5239455.1 hypothetical protein [Providencia rettgeri]ELT5686131.1 hypothetical protein [Providencia rettgeri]